VVQPRAGGNVLVLFHLRVFLQRRGDARRLGLVVLPQAKDPRLTPDTFGMT
jgi:hypothetical protein